VLLLYNPVLQLACRRRQPFNSIPRFFSCGPSRAAIHLEALLSRFAGRMHSRAKNWCAVFALGRLPAGLHSTKTPSRDPQDVVIAARLYGALVASGIQTDDCVREDSTGITTAAELTGRFVRGIDLKGPDWT
jgi:hypothetical protein